MEINNMASQPLEDFQSLPIASLDPSQPLPGDRGLKAEVVLLWPYSSSTRRAAILVSEPDFRLRRQKGQVRVQLRGPAAQALAASHISIGDHVHIGLEGARWVDEADRGAVAAPGRAVDGELVFDREIHIKILRSNAVVASISINEPPSPVRPSTPLPSTMSSMTTFKPPTSSSTYSSPAFMRHGGSILRSAIRPAFASQPDPLPFSTEDMIEEELDIDRPKKKAKFARKSGDWVFKQESASPELKPEDHEVTGTFDDVDMIERDLVAEEEKEHEAEAGHSASAITDVGSHTDSAFATADMELLDAPGHETGTLPNVATRTETPAARELFIEEATTADAFELIAITLLEQLRRDPAASSEVETQPSSSSAPQGPARPIRSSSTALAANGFALLAVEALRNQSVAKSQTPEREAIPEAIAESQAPEPEALSAELADALDAIAYMGAEDLEELDAAEVAKAEEDGDENMITGEEDSRPELEAQSQPSQSRQPNSHHEEQSKVGGASQSSDQAASPPRMSPGAATASDAFALIMLNQLSKSGKRINRAGQIEDIKDEDEDMESGNNHPPDFGYDGAASSKPFVQHQKFSQLANAPVPDTTEEDAAGGNPAHSVDQASREAVTEQGHKGVTSNVQNDDADDDDDDDDVRNNGEGEALSEKDMADEVHDDEEDEASRENDIADEIQEDDHSDFRSDNHVEGEDDNITVPSPHNPQAAKEEVEWLEAEDEHTNKEAQDVLDNDSFTSEDETHAQPIVEDESAMKHVASRQTAKMQKKEVQHEQKQDETTKATIGRRGRATKLMTFEEATAVSQTLDIPDANASKESHISKDATTAEAVEEEMEAEEESAEADAETDDQIDNMTTGENSVQQAEETVDYLLNVLPESSGAVPPATDDEQMTTTEVAPALAHASFDDNPHHPQSPAVDHEDATRPSDEAPIPPTRTSLRGVTMSPALAAQHQLEKPAQLARHESLPEAAITTRDTQADKALFKPHLPRLPSKNSGNISIINQLEDEHLVDQLLAQPQPKETVVVEEPHLDNPVLVQTPATSRKTRSSARSTGRKSAVPNELKGWFSPRVETGEAPERQREEDQDQSVSLMHELDGLLHQEEGQRMVLVDKIAAYESSHLDAFNNENVQPPNVQPLKVPQPTSAYAKLKGGNIKQARKSVSEELHPKTLHEGLQTALSYYTPLSNLHLHLNRVSSQSEPSTVDVLAIVSSAALKPSRATAGPRDHFTTLKVTTPPNHGKGHVAFPQTQVQIFRPAKDVLPVANVGDVVLLRDFAVRSAKGKCFLLSTASSSWCVWRFRNGSRVSVECLGPPVEIGDEEEEHARALRKLWVLVDKDEDDEDRDVEREEEVNGHMG